MSKHACKIAIIIELLALAAMGCTVQHTCAPPESRIVLHALVMSTCLLILVVLLGKFKFSSAKGLRGPSAML